MSIWNCNCDRQELRHLASANQYKMQCMDCGATGNALAHATLTDEQKAAALPVDYDINARWRESRRAIYAAEQEAERAERDRERDEENARWWRVHNAYLKTPQWKAKRIAVLRRDGYTCQACLTAEAAEVHHLNYDYHGHEPLFCLISVCKPCHDSITRIDRARRAGVKCEPVLSYNILWQEVTP